MDNPPEKQDNSLSEGENKKPRVVARMSDLYFVSRVEVAADHFDCRVEFLPGVEGAGTQIMGEIADTPTSGLDDLPTGKNIDLVIVDLNQPGAAGWIANIRENVSSDIPIIAFGSHVETGKLAAAREAGATKAVARSRFVEILPGLFEDLVS